MADREKAGVIMKVSPELRRRLEDYKRAQEITQRRTITLTEASKNFAQNAVTNEDRLNDAVRRMGKQWRFKV